MSDKDDLEWEIEKALHAWIDSYGQHAKRRALYVAEHLTTLGYTRAGLTEAQREAESAAIIKGFLDCPEIADCAPEDKDGDTHSLESRARRFLQGDAVPKPARRVVQIAIAQGWTIPAEKLSFVPEVIQLCDDGSVWTCALDSMKQRKLPPIPGDDA